MFDTNNFKRSVKEWINANPQADVAELVDYCEELIPPHLYQTYGWLLEQTTGWYQYVLEQRHRRAGQYLDDDCDA